MNNIDKPFFGIEPKEQIIIINKALEPLNLVDRFFFIINKLNENFEFHLDLHLLQNKTYDLSKIEKLTSNYLFENFGVNDYSEHLFTELQSIFKILKNRFNIGWLEESNNFSLFESYDHLLISRYAYPFWKVVIKQELSVQLKKGINIESLKSLIISSLEEIIYRTHLNYTWDVYQENLRRANSFDVESGSFFSRQTECIIEDLDWITNLSEEDLINQKIKLHKTASKSKLIYTIKQVLKFDKNFSKDYRTKHDVEVKKFINFITQSEDELSSSINPNFDLSFIPKKNTLNFTKIFYYFQNLGFITSKQKELNLIFSDLFKIGERTFQDFTQKKINHDLKEDKGIASFVNDYFRLETQKAVK